MTATFIDTHCHLNFKRFHKTIKDVIIDAKKNEISHLIVPGTDSTSSQKATELALEYEQVYAAVGIHPHHVYEVKTKEETEQEIGVITSLLQNKKVVAIGEVGLDRHEYTDTKYKDYTISDGFIEKQAELLKKQIKLAVTFKKSLILHNREAKQEMLLLLSEVWDASLSERAVFHCCEADNDLLLFAKQHNIFIGVDGDVTFDLVKRTFIRTVPIEMLVLETDSPFLLPEPLKSQKRYPNTPSSILLIAQCIATIKGIPLEEVAEITTNNAKKLFSL